jgi:phage-related protein
MDGHPPRELAWIGSAKKDFKNFPREVRREFGYNLFLAQSGAVDVPGAKPLSGGLLKGLGVVELIEDFDGDTYRAVYTAKIGSVIAVLHAFKKKSTSGISTPQHEIRLIRDRYRTAMRRYSEKANRMGGEDGR